jgi:hypothetical protein
MSGNYDTDCSCGAAGSGFDHEEYCEMVRPVEKRNRPHQTREMDMTDHAANLAFFLQEKTGTVCGIWRGHMRAAEQRQLFGQFLGKGLLVINGETETIKHIVRVCFSLDYDTRAEIAWRNLQ